MTGKKFFAFTIILLSTLFAAGRQTKMTAETKSVMSRPRKVYVAKTRYFDILFPEACKETASLLIENADQLYDQAKENSGFQYEFRMPVVISPDSDTLSVTYTQLPYNRIVIFEGLPEADQAYYQDSLLGLFYHEIYYAVVKAIRTPLHQMIAGFAGDMYEPIALVNVPFSYIQGLAYLEDGGRYNDGYFLQILAQAKLDDTFPGYFECSVNYDIYPGNDLLYAATSGFISYLIQAYGAELFDSFWQECGGMYLYFMPGIIYKIYHKPIWDLWDEYKDSIPLPDDFYEMEKLQKNVQKVFPRDREGSYQYVFNSDYGLVWYDAIRHEVSLYDSNSVFKLRQLLFLTDGVDRLSLAPDGRYMAISYKQSKNRPEFDKNNVRIYDLKKREILDYKFYLRDAAIVLSDKGENVLAGINVESKYPKLQIWTLPEDEDDCSLIFEKSFERTAIPSSITAAGNGKLSFIITKNNNSILSQINFYDGSEKFWELSELSESGEKDLNFKGLNLVNQNTAKAQQSEEDFIYTFQYVPREGNSFTRMGYISLDKNFEPKNLYLQTVDLEGGVYNPFLNNDYLYYISKKVDHSELCYIPAQLLPFEEGLLYTVDVEKDSFNFEPLELDFSKKELNGHKLSGYWPIKYMFPPGFQLFLPIRTISMTEGTGLWPGLGVNFSTESDPFMNNKIQFSAGWSYWPWKFTSAINASTKFKLQQEKEARNFSKDKSFAIFIENTSTPVDIKAGALFKFNLDGEYNFEALAGTSWKLPKGMNIGDLTIDIQSYYSASTDYYDAQYYNDAAFEFGYVVFESLKNWPTFDKAYDLFELSATVSYSNIHQYGITPFEKRGFSIGGRFYSFWDLYLLRVTEALAKMLKENIGKTNPVDGTIYTQEQYDEALNLQMLRVTQINTGLIGKIEIPRLTPLQMRNGFVLSVPATLNVEFLNKTGTALEVKPEILLLGWELHNGIPPLQLYISRMGIKAGYDLCLDYDTREVSLPDMRRDDYLYDLFSNTYVNDHFYFVLNIDASSPIGILSKENFGLNFDFEIYPRTHGFVFNFAFVSTF